MPNMALTFAALLGGAVIIDYGVKSAKSAFNNAPASNTSSTPSPAGTQGATFGQITYADVQAIGKQHGWSNQQINTWFHNLIPSESNGTLTDTNPQSGAYGIAQGITGPSWYAAHGGNANTVQGQLTGMANYIAQRYGNPSAAWSFHLQHGWY